MMRPTTAAPKRYMTDNDDATLLQPLKQTNKQSNEQGKPGTADVNRRAATSASE